MPSPRSLSGPVRQAFADFVESSRFSPEQRARLSAAFAQGGDDVVDRWARGSGAQPCHAPDVAARILAAQEAAGLTPEPASKSSSRRRAADVGYVVDGDGVAAPAQPVAP